LLAALTQLERAEATEIVLQTLREGFQGLGGIAPVESIWAADDLGLSETHCLILEDLVRQLDNAPSDWLLWHSLRRLSMTWQPDHLAALSEATHQLTAQSINIAQQMVDRIIQGVQATDDNPLRDEHAQAYALCTLAKCQPENFVAEVIRLLQRVNQPLILKICENLWVVGDCRAEDALLRKLEQPTSEDRSA
jgi:hypothetical protein